MTLTDEQMEDALAHAESYADEDLMADVLFGSTVGVETACEEGCEVEPDGKCPHGYPSPLRLLGMI